MDVVNAIILSKDKSRFLVIKRKEGIHAGKWAFPGGIVEKGETIEQALKREIKEEIGLEIVKVIRKISDYKYSRENRGSSRGQCFLVEIKYEEDVRINSEISDFKWLTLEELENLEHIEGMEEEAMSALYGNTLKIQTNKNLLNK